MGSRVEETQKLTEWVSSYSGTEGTYKDDVILNLNLMVSILNDISKSLAVIADAMQQDAETEK